MSWPSVRAAPVAGGGPPALVPAFARLPERHIDEAVRPLAEAAATTRPSTTARRAGGR